MGMGLHLEGERSRDGYMHRMGRSDVAQEERLPARVNKSRGSENLVHTWLEGKDLSCMERKCRGA